jgi:hypothetical protein
MRELGDLLTDEEITAFMKIMDVNNDGAIGVGAGAQPGLTNIDFRCPCPISLLHSLLKLYFYIVSIASAVHRVSPPFSPYPHSTTSS